MLVISEYSQFFIAMLAIVDPITILPLFLHLVRDFSLEQKRSMAKKTAVTVLIALTVTVFVGQNVLDFFGISIGSFQIAGGALLMMVALQLLNHQDPSLSQDNSAQRGASDVVVPLAIPILAGPGAFSTVIVFTYKSNAFLHQAVLCLCILIICAVVWVCLHLATKIMNYLSPLVIAIANKLVGLILAAISVEFIASGIKSLFLQ